MTSRTLDASTVAAQATPHVVRLADYQPPPFWSITSH